MAGLIGLQPSAIWTLLWKTVAVTVAAVIGGLGASGVGWHGAELVSRMPWERLSMQGLVEFLGLSFNQELITKLPLSSAIYFLLSAAMCLAPCWLIHKIARPVSFVIIPIFLWVAVVGAHNGIISDFVVSPAFAH